MSNITKDFSGVKVLEDDSFDLNMGEVHVLAGVLAGENGAGLSWPPHSFEADWVRDPGSSCWITVFVSEP